MPVGNRTASSSTVSTPELLTFSDGRAAQKARYGGELYPAEWPADTDGTTYLDFFQRDRLKQQKGIIALDLTGLP
jgi:hypothetical protein